MVGEKLADNCVYDHLAHREYIHEGVIGIEAPDSPLADSGMAQVFLAEGH
jgi:hypothetical protein